MRPCRVAAPRMPRQLSPGADMSPHPVCAAMGQELPSLSFINSNRELTYPHRCGHGTISAARSARIGITLLVVDGNRCRAHSR
jgi:hypothetical protein